MSSVTLSLILYAAVHSGQPCENVFQETARKANPGGLATDEQDYLAELAEAACDTSNPDIIWQIVQKESNFRFIIVRDNGPEQTRVLRGAKALAFLKRLPQKGQARNVDIGVMQFNWGWHRRGFDANPLRMLEPSAQVDYLLEHYGNAIFRRCSSRWVGCYHNSTDAERAAEYESAVRKKRQLLALVAIRYLQRARIALSFEQKAKLPVIRKEEVRALLRPSPSVPLPEKYIAGFIDARRMHTLHSIFLPAGLSG
jgi:hypothetical protein